MSPEANLSIRAAVKLDWGIDPHFCFVIMESLPTPDGKVFCLYMDTDRGTIKESKITYLHCGDHEFCSEPRSYIRHSNPLIFQKRVLISQAKLISSELLSLDIYKSIVDDFLAKDNEDVSKSAKLKNYFDLLYERNYYCMKHSCLDLPYTYTKTY